MILKNLVIVHKLVHTLIHATKKETIVKYKNLLQLDGKTIEKTQYVSSEM